MRPFDCPGETALALGDVDGSDISDADSRFRSSPSSSALYNMV
jgi:hypothetical protein